MALCVYFDSFGSYCYPIIGLIVSLGIAVELGKDGLDISFILDYYKASLEFLGEGHIIVSVSFGWCLIDSSSAW